MSFTFCPPEATLKELVRVCKPGGLLIIPTYIDTSGDAGRPAVRLLELLGLKFSRRFDEDAHAAFFQWLGYRDVEYYIAEGCMACDTLRTFDSLIAHSSAILQANGKQFFVFISARIQR